MDKLMNQIVIVEVFCGSNSEEAMHEECAKGGFK